MTLSAFGVSIDLPNPSFPHSTPRTPEQDAIEVPGHIYTVTHAPIAPQRLAIHIDDITADEAERLADFVVHVIEFSAYPCTITTDIATYERMHLIGGYESVVSRKGDISSARLTFREALDSVAIGKNLLENARLTGDTIAKISSWSLSNTNFMDLVDLGAQGSPFGYATKVVRVQYTAGQAASLGAGAELRAGRHPLVGTDLTLKMMYRRTRGDVGVDFRILYYAKESGGNALRNVSVRKVAGTTGWSEMTATVQVGDFPAGASFFAPRIDFDVRGSEITTFHVGQITAEYSL